MNRRRLTLIEVLQPRCFHATPERSRVTRTIVQPEIDSFEQMEAQSVPATMTTGKSALAGSNAPHGVRHPNTSASTSAHASTQLVSQLVGA